MDLDRDALLQVFRAESEEGLARMEALLVTLERQPGDGASEELAEIFRAVHTLKGGAQMLEFKELGDCAHVVEDLLDRLRSGARTLTPALVTLLLEACDSLRLLLDATLAGDGAAPSVPRGLLARVRAAAAADASPLRAAEQPAGQHRPDARATSQGRAGEGATTLRVSVEKLDSLLSLAGEIAVAQARVRQVVEGLGHSDAETLDALLAVDRLHLDLQERVMQARMVAVAQLFRAQARTVRDLASARGKQARLVSEGDDVEADMRVVQHLRDPLVHMVRNAVDHGLETPEARVALGKDPCGTITLRAFQEGGELVVQVADDGAGIDPLRVLNSARRRGLVGPGDSPPESEVLGLIFAAGFSTADQVTDLSGRGVGLDVVRRGVEALRGAIAVSSRPGHGTLFTIRLPLTLLVVHGLLVEVAGETYVLPFEAVVECGDLPVEARRAAERGGLLNLRDRPLPYVRLGALFGVGASRVERESFVVVQHRGQRAGLAVDRLLGETQAVIRPLGRMLRGVHGLAGATILGSGQVALMLDVSALLQEARRPGAAAGRGGWSRLEQEGAAGL